MDRAIGEASSFALRWIEHVLATCVPKVIDSMIAGSLCCYGWKRIDSMIASSSATSAADAADVYIVDVDGERVVFVVPSGMSSVSAISPRVGPR